jgi:hypothetical protein
MIFYKGWLDLCNFGLKAKEVMVVIHFMSDRSVFGGGLIDPLVHWLKGKFGAIPPEILMGFSQ